MFLIVATRGSPLSPIPCWLRGGIMMVEICQDGGMVFHVGNWVLLVQAEGNMFQMSDWNGIVHLGGVYTKKGGSGIRM